MLKNCCFVLFFNVGLHVTQDGLAAGVILKTSSYPSFMLGSQAYATTLVNAVLGTDQDFYLPDKHL